MPEASDKEYFQAMADDIRARITSRSAERTATRGPLLFTRLVC